MGSGCISGCPSLFQQGPTDKEVTYTGPAIPALGICTGDRLSEVEAVLIGKIIDYSTGVGINIPDIDLNACDLFKEFIVCCQGCTDLNCLMHVIFDSLCILDNRLTTVEDLVEALFNGPYNTGCLTLGANPTLVQIIQALILEFCALKTQVSLLQTQVNNLSTGLPVTIGNFLLSAISSCQSQVVKSGTGASASIVFKGFVPIGGIMPYGGPMNVFDTTGKGLSNTEMCGWALCNGNNGTWDLREEVVVGAGAGIMGGGTLPSNTNGSNYSMGQLVGTATVLLTGPQSGCIAHGHAVNDPGHEHAMVARFDSYKFDSGGQNAIDAVNPPATPGGPFFSPAGGGIIGTNGTGISIANSPNISALVAHENRQPSRALPMIQRIA